MVKNILKRQYITIFLAVLICLQLPVGAMAADHTSTLYQYAGSLGDTLGEESPQYNLGNPVAISKDSYGYYYVADLANNRILKLDSSFKCVETINDVDMPIFVYVDNNDYILVNEMGTHKIKKFDQDLQLVTEWGGPGTGEGEFNIPRSIVQDSRGDYYVSDELNHRIQKFDSDGNFITAYGSYGTAEGQFAVQQGLSIDAQDRLYVADTYNNRIQVFQTYPSWNFLKSFGHYGVYQPFNYFSFQPEIMNHPRGVYVEKSTGRVAVTDSSNNRVMVYNGYSSNFSFYQSQNGYLGMSLPTHAILENNKLIVLDSHSRILRYNSVLNNTNLFTEFGTYRNASDQFSNPQSVCVDQYTGEIYVSDSFNHRIMKFDDDGQLLDSYGGIGGPYGYGTALGFFAYPKQVTVNDLGFVYVADYGNSRVVCRDPVTGAFVLAAAVASPWGVAIGENNRLYVSSWSDNSIKVYQNGLLVNSWNGEGSLGGKLNKPSELKFGTYQGQDALFVADCGNNKVQIYSPSGTYLGQLGACGIDPLGDYNENKESGGMLLPYGIAVAGNGNIIVSDSSHKCMRVYDSEGNLLETWGTMSNTEGNFFSPMGCDIDQITGRLYVADGVLERVQWFNPIVK